MFNSTSYRDSTSGGGAYQLLQLPQPLVLLQLLLSQHQGQGYNDSVNQGIGIIQNSLRNLSNFTQYSAQQQESQRDLTAATLKDGFRSLGDSLTNLTKQIEISNKLTLFTLNNICNNSSDNNIQDSENRRGDEFRKLVNYIGNVDGNLLKDHQGSMNSPALHNNLSRTTSNSRVYPSLPTSSQNQNQNQQFHHQQQQLQLLLHHQQLQQVLRGSTSSGRRELSHHGSSTSLSASLKSNVTPPNPTRNLADKRQYQPHSSSSHSITAPVPQSSTANSHLAPPLQQLSTQQAQSQLRTRTSSQLASLDSSSPDNASKKQKKTYKDHEPIYVLTQPSKVSIKDAWLEYTVGLNGSPAVRDLEHQYKTRWRGGSNHTISKQYTNRIAFYKFLEDLEAQNRVDYGILFLEDFCAKNGNKNLRWLQFNMPPIRPDFENYMASLR